MRFVLIVCSILLAAAAPALAEDYTITLKDKQFSPQNLTVPANQKIKLTVKNQNATAAEFESSDLDREKVVTANGEITVFIGPLDAGSYGYFNDFDRTVTGTITAK
jgi:Cupredoxin-like domain